MSAHRLAGVAMSFTLLVSCTSSPTPTTEVVPDDSTLSSTATTTSIVTNTTSTDSVETTTTLQTAAVPSVSYWSIEEAESALLDAGFVVVIEPVVLPPGERESDAPVAWVDPGSGQWLPVGSEVSLGVYVDPSDLWVLEGDKPSGTWAVYDSWHGLASDCVAALAVGPGGEVWAGCSAGVSAYSDGIWYSMGAHGLGIIDLVVLPDGSAYVSAFTGSHPTVYRYCCGLVVKEETHKEWSRLDVGGFDLAIAGDGAVLLASSGDEGNVYVLDGQNAERVDGVFGHSFAVDPDGVVYASGPETPLYKYDRGTWTQISQDPVDPGESVLWPDAPTLNDIEFVAISQAPDGTIWAASTWYGVFRYDQSGWANYTIDDGLSSNNVTSIAFTDDGTIWFGTADSGITTFHPAN